MQAAQGVARGGVSLRLTQRQARCRRRRRRARRLVLDPLFVSAGVKHVLQASDSKSNPATHWGSAAAAGGAALMARSEATCNVFFFFMERSEATPTVDTGLYQEHPRRHHCPFSRTFSWAASSCKHPQLRIVPC